MTENAIDRNVPGDECSTADMLRKVAGHLRSGAFRVHDARMSTDEWVDGINQRADMLEEVSRLPAGPGLEEVCDASEQVDDESTLEVEPQDPVVMAKVREILKRRGFLTVPRRRPSPAAVPEQGEDSQPIYEPVGEYWLCAGKCGQWKKGMAAGHNGSGYVCYDCEHGKVPEPVETREWPDCEGTWERNGETFLAAVVMGVNSRMSVQSKSSSGWVNHNEAKARGLVGGWRRLPSVAAEGEVDARISKPVLEKWKDERWRSWAKEYAEMEYREAELMVNFANECEMHKAWRKRAEEAEGEVERLEAIQQKRDMLLCSIANALGNPDEIGYDGILPAIERLTADKVRLEGALASAKNSLDIRTEAFSNAFSQVESLRATICRLTAELDAAKQRWECLRESIGNRREHCERRLYHEQARVYAEIQGHMSKLEGNEPAPASPAADGGGGTGKGE